MGIDSRESIDLARKRLLETKFLYCTSRDVVICSRKYFPNARPKDRKSGADFACTYIYLVRNHLDSYSSDQGYQILANQLSMKSAQNVYYYIKRHERKWAESPRYQERIFLILSDLKKREKLLADAFEKKITQHEEF